MSDMTTGFYESDAAVEQYLLFHYGTPEQICPLLPEARTACGFPARCVSESLRHIVLQKRGRARLISVARWGGAASSWAAILTRSWASISPALHRRRGADAGRRAVTVRVPREGSATDELRLELPSDCGRIMFGLSGAMPATCAPISELSTWCSWPISSTGCPIRRGVSRACPS
jgi:hypothetical protein